MNLDYIQHAFNNCSSSREDITYLLARVRSAEKVVEAAGKLRAPLANWGDVQQIEEHINEAVAAHRKEFPDA